MRGKEESLPNYSILSIYHRNHWTLLKKTRSIYITPKIYAVEFVCLHSIACILYNIIIIIRTVLEE